MAYYLVPHPGPIPGQRLLRVCKMGFLDNFFDKDKKEERKYAKLQKTLTNMYVQAPERGYVIEQLRDLATPEAARVLLARYAESAPNSTFDIEEKERVYDVLVEFGANPGINVVQIVREHLVRVEGNVNWPLKVMTDLLSLEEFNQLMVELLASCNTDYKHNPEKKQELLRRAAEIKGEEIAEQATRFLEDLNEDVRFLAVDALLAQDNDELVVGPLAAQLAREESLRIVQKLCGAFEANQRWKIPDELREEVSEALSEDYGIHDKGHIYKRRR